MSGRGTISWLNNPRFDGRHGWFWRNRSDETVTLILRVKGAYHQIKRVL